jgi:hypothetical protein
MLLDATRDYHTLPDAIERDTQYYSTLLDHTRCCPPLVNAIQPDAALLDATYTTRRYPTLPYARALFVYLERHISY